MPFCVAVIGVWIAFALSSNRCRAGETTVVGRWSDPNRLEISGAIQIKPTSIVAALNSDVELQLAASPQAAYLDYFIALRRRISVIYQSRGFADVRVDCGPDSFKSKLVVRIVEGPCYVHGAIRVEGAKRIPFAEVVKQLREPSPPANASIESFDQVEGKRVPRWIGKDGSAVSLDDPVWAKGEATSFTAAGKTECIRKLTRYLADLGFPAAKFDVEIAADSATHTAALIVRLTDEGPEPVVKRIRVIGSKRNSDQAIIDYLGIRLGTHWSGAKAADWRYRLWRSGRFVRANIAATPCDDGADGLTLRIDVVELAVAPPIDEPLSAEETAMLKCRDWLAGFPERDEDAVIEFPPTSDLRKLTLVISHSGILFYRIDAAPKPGSAPLVHDAIVLTDRKLGWYALDRQLKFVAPLACKSRLIFDVGLDVIDEPKQRPKVAAGLGFTPTGQANFRSPVQLIIGGLPAAFLRKAHEIGVEFSLSDGVLTLTRAHMIGGASTRRRGDCCQPSNPMATVRRRAFRFKRDGMRPNASKSRRRPPASRTYSIENAASAARVRMLMESALCGGQGGAQAANPKTLAVWKKLLAGGALKPVDDWVAEEILAPSPASSIDVDRDPAWEAACASWLLGESNRLFTRESWLWSADRALAFILAGKEDDGKSQLTDLFDSARSGPLCFLAIATIEHSIGMDGYKSFARRGLDRLTLGGFHNDYRPLLDDRSLVGKEVFAVAGALRSLDSDEVERSAALYRRKTPNACATPSPSCAPRVTHR